MAKEFLNTAVINGGTIKYFSADALLNSEIESGNFDETIQVSDYSGAVATLHVWNVGGRTPIRVLDKAIYTINYEIRYKFSYNYIATPTVIEKVAVFNGTATIKPVDDVGFIIGISYDSSGRRCTYHIGSAMMDLSGTGSSWISETGKITLISDMPSTSIEVIDVSGIGAGGNPPTPASAISATGYNGYPGDSQARSTTNVVFVGSNYVGGGVCTFVGTGSSSDDHFECTGKIYKFS